MWEAGNDPEAEEGLGILMECVVSNTSKGVAIKRAEDRYLHYGLAKGMGGKPRNARQVFEITWRLEALQLSKDGIVKPAIEAEAKLSVQAHIDNLFRGTDHKLPGVHYGRAKLYLEGIAVVADYARAHGTEAGWLQRALKDSVANPGN
jgi:hypothetical protein